MFMSSSDPAKRRNCDKMVTEVDEHIDTLPTAEVVCVLLPTALQVAGVKECNNNLMLLETEKKNILLYI